MGYRGEDVSRTPADWGHQQSSPGTGQGNAGSWVDEAQGYGNGDYDDYASDGSGHSYQSGDGYGGYPQQAQGQGQYSQHDPYGPQPPYGEPGGYDQPGGYGEPANYGHQQPAGPDAGYGLGQGAESPYGQQDFGQPEPGYGLPAGGGQGYQAPNDDYGRPGAYGPRHGGTGSYPAAPDGGDGYPGRDAGNDWYGGQPAAAAGASFADTGTFALNGRIADEYGTGPNETHNPAPGYPPGPGQPQAPGQTFGRAQLPAPVPPGISGPQAVPRTGAQEVYDDYDAYPGYGRERNPTGGYPSTSRNPTGGYPAAGRNPTGEYPTTVGNPTGGYPVAGRNPTGEYPTTVGNPTGGYPAAGRNPTGEYPTTVGNSTGGYPVAGRNPTGEYPTTVGNSTGGYPAAGRNPTGEYPTTVGNSTGGYPAAGRNPTGEYPTTVGNPTGGYPAAGRNPTGGYPATARDDYDAYAPDAYGQDFAYGESGQRGRGPGAGYDNPAVGYDEYATNGDPYADRYGEGAGGRGTGKGGRGKTKNRSPKGPVKPGRQASPGGRRPRTLALALGTAVVVVVAAAAAYFLVFKPSPTTPSPNAGGRLPSAGASPSNQACVQQDGTYCHIESRTLDPAALTLAKLYPPVVNNEANGNGKITSSFTLETTKLDTSCASAVIGQALITALKAGQCTQVLRASYLSGDGKIMGTIGVINLVSTNEAHYAGKVVGQNDFIAPLATSKGVASKLGQGTGVVEAQYKGHYLILTWSEFVNGSTPSTMAEDNQLEQFSSELVAGTANVNLSDRMVNGDTPANSGTAS